jgi:hypothetical protein
VLFSKERPHGLCKKEMKNVPAIAGLIKRDDKESFPNWMVLKGDNENVSEAA